MKLSSSKHLNEALMAMGIVTPKDVIDHLPYRYDDFSLTSEIELYTGKRLVLYGRVTSAPTMNIASRYKIVTFMFISSAGKNYRVTAFNRPYLRSAIHMGQDYTLIGTYDRERQGLNLVTFRAGTIAPEERLRPVYALPSSIEQHVFHRLARRVWEDALPSIKDNISERLRRKYRLLEKSEALRRAHFPLSKDDVIQGLRVIKYEEALIFSVKTQLIRRQNRFLHKTNKPEIDLLKINDFIKTLPYKLSKDQTEAVRNIVGDMNKQSLMYRLLEGDVGSGKTVVAAIGLYANWLRKDQGALMAPTDALAKQHFSTLKDLFKGTGIQVALLVGALTPRERENVREGLLDGVLDIVVGTHALFSQDIVYQSLGLAIVDEQHRFGVNQRTLLSSKGSRADLLLMSATPIPRTLALTIYGDMDLTTIRQFPHQKRQVTTYVNEPSSSLIEETINKSLNENRRIFIVAPLIEEGEDTGLAVETLFDQYQRRYRGKVGLLHGRMKADEKDQTLDEFRSGACPILVTTTVIEVGIDVPNADAMIVYDAHRFGLASLHQLRGRIGRDGAHARFILVTDIEEPEEHARLKVLSETDDGFQIAEADLKHRGPGEMIGVRQSGLPSFAFVDIYSDYKMLECARDDAIAMLDGNDPSDRPIIDMASQGLDEIPYA